ncbi:MAG: acyl-CoA dehydrogenase family protein [Pyrinomonadaceae bacterium]
MTLPQYKLALDLEAHLGDPFDPLNDCSLRAAVAWDEMEAYPEPGVGALNAWGLPRCYVPADLGGRHCSYEELLHVVRAIARRDVTLAVAHGGTYLGAVPVWLAGDAGQRARLARIILEGGQVSLALTERAHGADLLAGDVRVSRGRAGYTLSGEKWLIGNAGRSHAVTVLARTEADGGARGFSLLLLERAADEEGRCRSLPRVKTHGVRGADISGLHFDELPLPADSFVGTVGGGLETVLKALQVTRTLCAGFSLGAADTALRITLDFAVRRRLYNGTVLDIPYARELLRDSFLDLLICDAVAVCGARALHAAQGQTSVWSAVVKSLVPATVERLVGRLSGVLGARFYLREGHGEGAFQKILRDCAVVGLFDGSTAVNLEVIALQLGRRLRARQTERALAAAWESSLATFDLAKPLPECRLEELDMVCRGADPVLSTLPLVEDDLAAACEDLPRAESAALKLLLAELRGQLAALRSEADEARGPILPGRRPPARLFGLAERYGELHAAASCLHLWLRSRTRLDSFFGDGVWLILCLRRLLKTGVPVSDAAALPRWQESVDAEMLRRHAEHDLFSLAPLALPKQHAEKNSYAPVA